jgi:predicted ATP-binding protein involved in virulence
MGCVNSKGMSNILTSIPPIVKKNIDGSNTIRRKSNEKETEEKETEEKETDKNFKDSKGNPIIENNFKDA